MLHINHINLFFFNLSVEYIKEVPVSLNCFVVPHKQMVKQPETDTITLLTPPLCTGGWFAYLTPPKKIK